MSVERAGRLVAALAGRSDREADHLALELLRVDDPSAAADAIVAASAPREGPPRYSSAWNVATGLAALLASALGARAIADLDALLPGDGTGLWFLPLGAIAILVFACLTHRSRRRRVEASRGEGERLRLIRALADLHLPAPLVLDVAAFVTDTDRSAIEERFDARHLRQHLALDEASREAQPAQPSGLIVGFATIWSVVTFWALYFLAFGRAALVGAW